jgi:hypothetical protein
MEHNLLNKNTLMKKCMHILSLHRASSVYKEIMSGCYQPSIGPSGAICHGLSNALTFSDSYQLPITVPSQPGLPDFSWAKHTKT